MTTHSSASARRVPVKDPDRPEGSAGSLLGGVLDTSAAAPAVRPQDDLFRCANGAWIKTAQIPADRPGTGTFLVLRETAEAACRDILDGLVAQAEPNAAPTALGESAAPSAKIASLYASFLDEERIEELGAAPLEAEFAPILNADDKNSLARVLGAGIATGFSGPVAINVEVDLNDPDHYTTWMGQSGLGLPDESYYRQEARAKIREAYTAHVARMLDLAGLPQRLSACAEALAAAVMAVETALAAGHWDRVACRDVEKMNNPRTWAEITESAPDFAWEAWRSGIDQAAADAGADGPAGTAARGPAIPLASSAPFAPSVSSWMRMTGGRAVRRPEKVAGAYLSPSVPRTSRPEAAQ